MIDDAMLVTVMTPECKNEKAIIKNCTNKVASTKKLLLYQVKVISRKVVVVEKQQGTEQREKHQLRKKGREARDT